MDIFCFLKESVFDQGLFGTSEDFFPPACSSLTTCCTSQWIFLSRNICICHIQERYWLVVYGRVLLSHFSFQCYTHSCWPVWHIKLDGHRTSLRKCELSLSITANQVLPEWFLIQQLSINRRESFTIGFMFWERHLHSIHSVAHLTTLHINYVVCLHSQGRDSHSFNGIVFNMWYAACGI